MACPTRARHQTHKRCLSRRARRRFDHSLELGSVRSTVDARRVDVARRWWLESPPILTLRKWLSTAATGRSLKFQFFLSVTKSKRFYARNKRIIGWTESKTRPIFERRKSEIHIYFNIAFDSFIIDNFFG